MKLLLFIDSLGSGGAQRQLTTIAPLLKQQGIDVEVLCYCRNEFFAHALLENGIPIHWITLKNYLIRILKIRDFIRKGNYNAVISFLDTPDLLNCIAAIGGHSWKVITSERSAKEENFHTLRGKLIGWMKGYSDAIVCNSENARNLWLKYYPYYRDKLEVIYNIVTLPEITSTYIPRKDGKIHIVVAASYQYLKNPINVIEAVNLLDEDLKEKLKIDWYGRKEATDSDTRAFDDACFLRKKYCLQNIFRLNEAVSDVVNRMHEADVVGLFSRLEGLPNVICEAMLLSKPVVMSRVSDYQTLVDSNNGVLCDWNDVFSIKEALEILLECSEEELVSLGKNSNKKAEILFGKEKITNQWIKAIQI
ncbi:glycosyltransferase [Bacteroides sp. CG01]|uniref:glycosyltransferase n=1 Tax=Bacteroides sp. CG01 TaxID=3096000 RepID=UPI002AFE7A5A|nr:glycosyltransferase [Bacteroides sp. CG01]